MKKLRVGVVGLGHRGRHMLRLTGLFDELAIPAAGCDVIPENWYEKQWLSPASMAEMFPDAAFYEDYDRMLDEGGLDVVIVETGADIHAGFCAKALSRNINVLTDIPVVANLQEAEMLWKAEQGAASVISVGANPNEQNFCVRLQEFYRKGLLGKPYYMEAEYIHWVLPGSEMHVHLNENGDWRKLLCPIRYCTHSLGPLLTVLEEDLRKVSCFGTGPQAPDSTKDDMSCAQFQTDSGVVVRLLRNGRCRADIGQHAYRVFGTEGYMEKVERMGVPYIYYNSRREPDPSLKRIDGSKMPPAYKDNPKAKEAGHDGIDFAMLDHFLRAVAEGRPAPISLRQGLAMTLPGIYAEESSKRGGALMRMRYPWDPDWKPSFD